MSTGLSLANLAEERLGGYSFLGGLGTIDRDEQFKEELEKRVRKHSYAPADFVDDVFAGHITDGTVDDAFAGLLSCGEYHEPEVLLETISGILISEHYELEKLTSAQKMTLARIGLRVSVPEGM